MITDNFILVGKKPVMCANIIEWAEKMKSVNCRVALDETKKIKVSTVFLGMDHNWGEGPPLLFKTMIFGGKNDEYQERYSTWEEAEEGHKKACKLAGIKTKGKK